MGMNALSVGLPGRLKSWGERNSLAAAGSIVRGVSIAMAGGARARATLVRRFTVHRAFSRTHGPYFPHH